jgi:hypothetical protein
MRKITPFIFACVLLFTVVLTGCASWFQTACAKVTPVLVLGQAYGSEAAAAVDQAASYAAGLNLPADIKAKVAAALENARKALRVGQIALAGAADACSQLDPVQAFSSFTKAWKEVRDVLGTAGPVGAHVGGIGGFPFDDPAIYRIAVSQQQR